MTVSNRAVRAAYPVLATVALLAACGTAPVRDRPAPVRLPASDPAAVVPTAVANVPSARAHVTLDSCRASGTAWRATGSARNPGGRPKAYSIVVFFANDRATVLGSARTQVTVKPHGTASWTAIARLRVGSGLRCVLRGVG